MNNKNVLAGVVAAAALAVSSQSAHALVTQLDTFTVVKGGPILFQDTFDDGVPPPVAPGEFASYLFQRGTFVETGGKLTLNTATAPLSSGATGNPSLTTRATLSTNVVESDLTTGLKSTHTFSVTAIYSLVDGTVPGDNYGIRLADRNPFGDVGLAGSPFGDDFVELRVSHSTTTGNRIVSFRRQDFPADTVTNIAALPLTPGDFTNYDQIALTLAKNDEGSNQITASFSLLSSGVAFTTTTFGPTTAIFHGENWTRAEFVASHALTAPVPEPETYAMMLAGIGLVAWQLRRKARRARNQRIIQA